MTPATTTRRWVIGRGTVMFYLAELLKKKKQVGSASYLGIFIIELFAFPNKSWVYDTGCGTHVCITKQEFKEARKLKQGALYLYVGNGVRAQVEAIGSYDLVLPNVLAICLNNFSKNNVHYFNAIPSNGIYEIDMHDLVPNVNSIYNVNTKRAKHNLDSTYLWHGRLALISKKRLGKLQQEGLLKSTDDESFDQCISCLSGKMTRKSFPHRPERATDLLGIIHTDVFKNEVENQLGKTIKALRSDRGGEYISQEFKDYLKACGIFQQLTPPYTPQHNGIPERRNHTLLDMVRSMMNLTTLPLSFWDYALESATRILNMVPTKKVDKTPYELWYGKVPNLSYLKVWGCEALVKRDTPYKLQQRSVKYIFIGYLKETMGYYFYFPPENKIIVARVDYEETFSPVADIRAIKILISIAAFYDYEIWQMDVKTAFLNGYLDEDIYMVQREGFVDPNHPRKVSGSNVTFLILYIDDIIIMRNHIPSLQSVKDYLRKCFAMKDLGEAAFILGIKIYRDRSKRLIGLGQNAYIDKILKRYRMDNSKRGHIPMQERLDLNKTQGASTPEEVKRMQNVPYASDVGSTMYAVRCTIPDVAFAQNITNYFQQNPGECHWTAVKNILKYLTNTKDMFLVYGGNPEADLQVDCYCDAGFETDRDDTKSQTGYIFILNGAAADWKSSKKFISGLGIVPRINEPIKMFCDNSAALHFANEPGVQRGARHYHRRYHYVRECIALGEIRFFKVHTDDNLADPFTKALPKGKLSQHARSMGLRLASSFM
ncbi:retrotransposon protein, putative, ty1-copia subclass [Tanacetum coccineum]